MKYTKSHARPLSYPQSLRNLTQPATVYVLFLCSFLRVLYTFLDFWLVATPKRVFMLSSSSHTCVNFVSKLCSNTEGRCYWY